jgi:hypothetical protein
MIGEILMGSFLQLSIHSVRQFPTEVVPCHVGTSDMECRDFDGEVACR